MDTVAAATVVAPPSLPNGEAAPVIAPPAEAGAALVTHPLSVPELLLDAVHSIRDRLTRAVASPEPLRAKAAAVLEIETVKLRTDLADGWLRPEGGLSVPALKKRLRLREDATYPDLHLALLQMANAVRELDGLHRDLGLLILDSGPTMEEQLIRLRGLFASLARSNQLMERVHAYTRHRDGLLDRVHDQTAALLTLFDRYDSGLTQQQDLLLFLLAKLRYRGYRRLDGDCAAEVDTPAGFPTRTWKKVATVRDFILEAANKETAFHLWKLLTRNQHSFDAAVHHLRTANEAEFPDVRPDGRIHSFENGVYFLHEDRFYPNESDELRAKGRLLLGRLHGRRF